MIKKRFAENLMKNIFLIAACTSVLAVALICFFLFTGGVPAIIEIGVPEFITGLNWRPNNNVFGILPMIIGSIYITLGAIIVGVPIGVLTAVYMAEYCPKKVYKLLKGATELLAGIPSVVYGFFGLVLVVPIIREIGLSLGFPGNGNSMLTAAILLGIMILPTIIGVTEATIRQVPRSYYEGALALGATKERSIFSVIIPACKSGVVAAVVLGIGRAIGETMAVIMVAGNQPRIPNGIFEGVRTLTANIALEMGYAADLHKDALIATAVVLFVFILLINLIVSVLNRRSKNV